MKSKFLSLLGLARRAGKITWHEEANLGAIRTGKAKLLILACDAGTAVTKKYHNKSSFYQVPVVVAAQKEELGHAIGTSPRAAIVVFDEGFASQLKQLTIE